MSDLREGFGLRVDELLVASRTQRTLRAVVAVAPVAGWWCAAAGGRLHADPLGVLLFVASLVAGPACGLWPGGRGGLAVPVLVAAPWLRSDSVISPWLLGAALCLIAFQLAASAAAAFPAVAQPDRELLRPWWSRAAGLVGVAVLAWLAAGASTPRPAVRPVAVAALALAAAAGWLAHSMRQDP